MICPQCKGEYREGYTTCATCQVPLLPTPETLEPPQHVRAIPLLIAIMLGMIAFVAFSLWLNGHLAWYWFLLAFAVASAWATKFGMKLL
jgi:hypothetical protein